ncbi:copper chaperone PCu(A)C [Streptomyces sp. NPDC088124]|uniref:copper chaperone PCu(A)C n=1 Tax=Streptomyces sp. NPDC088124 TaxID=3154654 RepID=UPI00341B314D
MTKPATQSVATAWKPTRARVREALLAAGAPVVACALALGALTTWVNAGAAGSRPQIGISDARIFLQYGDSQYTSAYFRIANGGDSDDELVSVTSPEMAETMLSRDQENGDGAASMNMVNSATVPGRGTLAMSPYGLNVMVKTKKKPHWQLGDTVPFILHFRYSGSRESTAVVVRPSSD